MYILIFYSIILRYSGFYLVLWLFRFHSVVVKVSVAAPAAVTVAVAKSTGAPSSKICPSI
ncbi:hypothetical protein BGI15_07870 [Snodgrassella alvi]|nr:hypothetical protein BGI07_08200 [Snodgrassella alvi]ORF32206.1 hypothetical protein BGI10_03425 [Snodgrassella alvi]ORF33482.1 hypothetical protein BGI11_08720 [Snodgrassella alvi]ORF38683.1 hypothetical protein BGI13_05795 [Snodgrassella alvi]ORF41501.1 hypothetical protein BGI14_02365 [Snodgrassella alvi]